MSRKAKVFLEKTQWMAIRTAIEGGARVAEVAKQYEITASTIYARARKQGWGGVARRNRPGRREKFPVDPAAPPLDKKACHRRLIAWEGYLKTMLAQRETAVRRGVVLNLDQAEGLRLCLLTTAGVLAKRTQDNEPLDENRAVRGLREIVVSLCSPQMVRRLAAMLLDESKNL